MGLFERKEAPKQNKNSASIFWTFLQWFWILVPVFYFFMVLPTFTQGNENSMVPIEEVLNLIALSFNLALGGVMYMMEPAERARNGAADVFLKMAFIQQLLIGQLVGVVLVGLAWFKLPAKAYSNPADASESDKTYLSSKTIMVITGLVLAFTLITVTLRFIN